VPEVVVVVEVDPLPEVVVVVPVPEEVVVVEVCPQPMTANSIKRKRNPRTVFFICKSPFQIWVFLCFNAG